MPVELGLIKGAVSGSSQSPAQHLFSAAQDSIRGKDGTSFRLPVVLRSPSQTHVNENGQMLSDEGIEILAAAQVLAVGRLRRFGKSWSFQECSDALGTAV